MHIKKFSLLRDKDFVPDSEKVQFTYDYLYSGPNIKVPHITTQGGRIDDIIATRIYYKDHLKCIKRGHFPHHIDYNKIWEHMNLCFVIKSPDDAIRLREECLRKIVENLFFKKEYDCYTRQRKGKSFFQEGEYGSSDLFFHKRDDLFNIKLFAYFHDVVCSEAEIGQAISHTGESLDYSVSRYFFPMTNPKFKSYFRDRKDIYMREEIDIQEFEKKPKIILITSGNLRCQEFLDLIQQGVDRKEFDELVVDHYAELQDKITSTDGLDDRVALEIYKRGIQEWRKLSRIPFPKIYKLHVEDIESWETVIRKTDANIILVPSEIFYYILQKEYLPREVRCFDLLQNTSLEELMIDPTLLSLVYF